MKTDKKTLVSWWGALQGGGETSGDLLSVMSVCRELDSHGIPYDVCSRIEYTVLKPQVDWKRVDPHHYGKLVFVCGPVIFENLEFRQLLLKFDHCKKIALGVSGITSNSHFPLLSFDKYLCRDGFEGHSNFMDLAINALKDRSIKPSGINPTRPIIGLCLRGPQRDYGAENCLSDKVNHLIEEVVKTFNFITKPIDTKLSSRIKDPFKAYNDLCESTVVITTRLHGSLLSLAGGVPFIAIDQIKGGAKVGEQLKLIDWPYSYQADTLSSKILIKTVDDILSSNEISTTTQSIREQAFNKAQASLSKGIQMLMEN